MSQLLNPLFAYHRKLLEFAQDHRPYVVVQLDKTSEPTAIAGQPELRHKRMQRTRRQMHTSHVVYHLRKDELGWHCDYHDIR